MLDERRCELAEKYPGRVTDGADSAGSVHEFRLPIGGISGSGIGTGCGDHTNPAALLREQTPLVRCSAYVEKSLFEA